MWPDPQLHFLCSESKNWQVSFKKTILLATVITVITKIITNVWIIPNEDHVLQLEITYLTVETVSISNNCKNDKNNNLCF